MNTNQKGFANIVLVVVIVILVGVVGYFAFVKKSGPVAQQPTPTPTQTPTSKTINLQTYTNTKYGFEFQYPQTVILNSTNDYGSETTITNDSTSVQVQYTEKKGVIFWVRDPGITSLTTDNIKNQFGATNKDNITLVATKISGADGYKVLFQNVGGVVSDFYFIKKGSQILELTVLKDDTNASKILSTFKFTN